MVPDPNDGGDEQRPPDSPASDETGGGSIGENGDGGGNGDGNGDGNDDRNGDEKWYGVGTLRGTKDATVELLWPPEVGVWLRLAVIALFVGGAGGAPTSGFNTGGTGGGSPGGGPTDLPPPPDLPVSPDSLVPLVIGVVVALVVLALLFAVVGAVMEFVLVESLRSREVRIRSRFRTFLGQGLRLFGFRLVLGLVVVAAVVVPLLLVFGLGVAVSPFLLVLAFPVLLLFGVGGLVVWGVTRVTTDFVVPAMLAEDRGVVDGWRRVWPVVREEWKQVGVYLLIRVGIGIGAGIAAGLATLLVLLVVAIPFALFAGITVFAIGWTTYGFAVLGVLGVLFVLVAIAVTQVVQVVPMTFLRYYSLAVLGRLDTDLDLVPWFEGQGTAT